MAWGALSAVLGILFAQAGLVVMFWRLPEYARLRRRARIVGKWFRGRSLAGRIVATAGGITGIVKAYGRVHLSSRTLVTVLAWLTAAVIGYAVTKSFWWHRNAVRRGLAGGALAGVTVLAVTGLALTGSRAARACEVLHPFDEPRMSVRRHAGDDWIAANPTGPFLPDSPPPLSTSAPTPPPPLGRPRAARIPSIHPAAQPEETAEPIAGCFRDRHQF